MRSQSLFEKGKHIALLLPPTVGANARDPNGIENKPQLGWSLWLVKAEVENADFSSGFSNVELGRYLEF